MIQESKRKVVELPDRKEISLCEAVTVVIFGKAINVKEYGRRDEGRRSKIESESLLEMFDRPTPANKQIVPDEQSLATAKLNDLLERLRAAAYAGRIKFRAIKGGEDPTNGYREIDPLYFYVKPFFNWSQDVIFNREDESATVWYFVHLDRGQFASLLKEIGVTVQDAISTVAPAASDEATLSIGEAGLHPKAKVGRKSFAAPIRQVVFDLMDDHGDLWDGDREWSRQADVEKAVRAKLRDDAPADSTIRVHVSSAIAEWRKSKENPDN